MTDSALEVLALDIRQWQRVADRSINGYKQLLTSLQAYQVALHKHKNTRDAHKAEARENVETDETSDYETLESICQIIRPPALLLQLEELDEGEEAAAPFISLRDVYTTSTTCSLAIIADHLNHTAPPVDSDLSHSLTTALATFHDSSEPWSSSILSSLVTSTLSPHSPNLLTERCLINHLLRDTIKPLFGRSSGTITTGGRASIRPTKTEQSVDDRPWREGRPETLTLLAFAITHLTSAQIEENWPLVIPPVLKTLDTGDVVSKWRGCRILEKLLGKVSAGLLKKTGLGEVLWQAVMPCLHYLPPLTPVKVSKKITDAAVDDLILLAFLRYPEEEETKEKAGLFSQILRDGIFQGLVYAGDNVAVLECFVVNTRKLVKEMGIYSVRHLTKILVMCTNVLVDPFITASRELLTETLETLKLVMLVCWPRIAAHQAVILKGLVVSWVRVCTEEKGNEDFKWALRGAVKVLRGATVGEGGIEESVEKIVAKEERCRDLFKL